MAEDSTEFVGSHLKSKNGYGQNGFQGASSDTPGEHTTSGFLSQSSVPVSDWQTRPVSPEQKVPTAHAMRSRVGNASSGSPGGPIPPANIRRASVPSGNRSFQR